MKRLKKPMMPSVMMIRMMKTGIMKVRMMETIRMMGILMILV